MAVVCVAGAAGLVLAGSAQALTIIPTFDSSITGASNAAEIENRIVQDLQFYHNFSDPVDVSIYFRLGTTNLGESLTSHYYAPYADYVSGLGIQAALHPENAVLQSAYANLPFGNFDTNVLMTSAELNTLIVAFGFTVPGFVNGTFDGMVTLSDAAGKINFSDNAGPGQYDATATIQHEVDEVLGIGGAGSVLNDGPPGSGFVGAFDLNRYADFHIPSLSTDPEAAAYFSYDGGATKVMDFNQNGIGDFGDWARTNCSGTRNIQDWADCSGGPRFELTRGGPEVLALEAIGYNLAPVPEPAIWALMMLGFGLTGAALRSRSATSAISFAE